MLDKWFAECCSPETPAATRLRLSATHHRAQPGLGFGGMLRTVLTGSRHPFRRLAEGQPRVPLLLVSLRCVLDAFTRFFDLLADCLCRLVDFLAGFLCRTFLLLAARECDKQGTDDQCCAAGLSMVPHANYLLVAHSPGGESKPVGDSRRGIRAMSDGDAPAGRARRIASG